MPEHALVPLDGSPQSWDALEYAFAHHPDAELTVLTVIDPIEAGASHHAILPGSGSDWYETEKATVDERFTEVRNQAPDDVSLTTVTDVGRPARLIIEHAEINEIDHIILGSHGRTGVTRILLGSVAEAVIRRSPVPVTIVR